MQNPTEVDKDEISTKTRKQTPLQTSELEKSLKPLQVFDL
jgi:hypothetical protein